MSYAKGLEGVIAGETAISNVEGDVGRLSYRGYDIMDLATLEYETVMWLLIFGELPDAEELGQLNSFLMQHGTLSKDEIDLISRLPASLHPMRMLQSMVPLLTLDRSLCFRDLSSEAVAGLQIIARMPTLIAISHQQDGPSFDTNAMYLANFLNMFTGTLNPDHLKVLQVAQILQMEHGFNAGTFTSHVVGSTLAPIDAVISAAIGALFGILHGGADQAALQDAQRVGNPENAERYIDQLFADKALLMGMGHREYRTVDPRASILKPMAEALCLGSNYENDYLTLAALEAAFNHKMKAKGKEVWANVEFYKGAVYEAIGIPQDYFTALFAMSRCVGWLAHFIECRSDSRIIRPKAQYIGAAPRALPPSPGA